MGACDDPRDENPLSIDTRGYGPETRGLMGTLSKGFGLLARLFQQGVDTLVNLEIIRSPETFAFLKSSTGTDVTPGSPKEIARNSSNVLLVIYVRSETFSPGVAQHLILDTDATRCTLAKARVVKHSVNPEAKVLLEPNQRLYADVTDGSGGTQVTFRVTACPIPLQGSSVVFKEG